MLPSRPSPLLRITVGLVDLVSVFCVKVNGALVVGGRFSPGRVWGTCEIWETT